MRLWLAAACIILGLVGIGQALAQVRFPEPVDGSVIIDDARMLSPADAQEIEALAAKLRAEKGFRLDVVTIPSLDSCYVPGWTIEQFAYHVQAHLTVTAPNDLPTAVLLLVSKDDRKARIHLGLNWGSAHDGQSQQIMNTLIVPRMKIGEPSTAILLGVQGLDKMARGEPLPSGSITLRVRILLMGMWKGVTDLTHVLAASMSLVFFAIAWLIDRFFPNFARRTSGNDNDHGWFGGWGGGGGGGGGGSWGGGATGSW